MDTKQILLVSSIVATGLMAGLFYGWSVSVIPGTRRIPSTEYVSLMQHVNRAILTPRFLVPFFGIPVLLGAAAFTHFRAGDQRRGAVLTARAATYLIGVLGVTAARNLPLNESIDSLDLEAMAADQIEHRRASHEGPWNRWNTVRTIANMTAFALATTAAVLSEQTG